MRHVKRVLAAAVCLFAASRLLLLPHLLLSVAGLRKSPTLALRHPPHANTPFLVSAFVIGASCWQHKGSRLDAPVVCRCCPDLPG